MKNNEKIKFYCFNKLCGSSIFNEDNCVVVEVPLENALSDKVFCPQCFEELISKSIINLQNELLSLIEGDKIYQSIIIDDDLVYHRVFKELLKNSNLSVGLKHYRDGMTALNFLFSKRTLTENLPDVIFLDVNMPKMDAWEFLVEFEKRYLSLGKQIRIYLMSSRIHPNDAEKIKSYEFVETIINKPYDQSSLDVFSNSVIPPL